MKVYKIRHKPTGLFYTKVINGETEMNKYGELFYNKPNKSDVLGKSIDVDKILLNKYNFDIVEDNLFGCYIIYIESDWEIVEYELVGVKKNER